MVSNRYQVAAQGRAGEEIVWDKRETDPIHWSLSSPLKDIILSVIKPKHPMSIFVACPMVYRIAVPKN